MNRSCNSDFISIERQDRAGEILEDRDIRASNTWEVLLKRRHLRWLYQPAGDVLVQYAGDQSLIRHAFLERPYLYIG